MSSLLYRVLSKNESVLTDSIIQQVTVSGAEHYQEMEEDLLQKRVEQLVDSFLMSIREHPAVFISYLKQIVQERISEGIFLHEIQIVLQILEERAWELIVGSIPQGEQVGCLGRITATIGAAKDQLAILYLQHFEKAEKKAMGLQQRLDELTKGTDSGPIEEDDLPARVRL